MVKYLRFYQDYGQRLIKLTINKLLFEKLCQTVQLKTFFNNSFFGLVVVKDLRLVVKI